MAEYDTTEARRTALRLRESIAPDREKRVAAGKLLVETLAKVAKGAGLEASLSDNQQHVEIGFVKPPVPWATVIVTHAGEVQVSATGAPKLGLELMLDPEDGLFKTTLLDTSVAPTPGQPIPRRSAVAVAMDALMWSIWRGIEANMRRGRGEQEPTEPLEADELPAGCTLVKP